MVLIPKYCPQSLWEFRFIYLLGSLYKLVAKVLASRLASVMDKIISSNQSISLKVDNWWMEWCWSIRLWIHSNDLRRINSLSRWTFGRLMIRRARVFLDYMLKRFGFDEKRCALMRVCVFADNLYVLVNECPT